MVIQISALISKDSVLSVSVFGRRFSVQQSISRTGRQTLDT